MTFYTSKQIFYINSKNRLNGSDSNFSYLFNIDPHETFTHATILSCSIPKTFYLIQNGLNTFQLTENTTTVTITFPAGNYTRTSLASTCKSLLNSSSPSGWVYNVTYPNIVQSNDTGKYTFSVTGNTSQPRFIFTTNLYEQLGFVANTTYNFSGGTLTSPNVCNLSVETTLFIHSDMCQNTEDNNVIQAIYSNGDASYSYINFYNNIPLETSRPIRQSKSYVYYFQITDEDGNEIQTNGVNINFTLMFFRMNNIDELIRASIKYFTLKDA